MDTFTRVMREAGIRKLKRKSAVKFVLFVFRELSSAEYSRFLRDYHSLPSMTVVKLRMGINDNGYILNNLKPCMWWCYKRQIYQKKDVLKAMKLFHVRRDDYKVVDMVWDERVSARLHSLREYPAIGYDRLQSKLKGFVADTLRFTNKFVAFKMRFIVKNPHNAVSVDDISHDCIAKGLQTMLLQYPRIDSQLHALNLVKRGIHNYGINYIKTMTRSGRNAIQQTASGDFTSRVIAITSQISEELAQESEEPHRQLESSMTCRSLAASMKGKRAIALKLLFGIKDDDFTEWLNQQGVKGSNDDWWHRLEKRDNLEKYEQHICWYLGVGLWAWIDFKESLAKKMGIEHNEIASLAETWIELEV